MIRKTAQRAKVKNKSILPSFLMYQILTVRQLKENHKASPSPNTSIKTHKPTKIVSIVPITLNLIK